MNSDEISARRFSILSLQGRILPDDVRTHLVARRNLSHEDGRRYSMSEYTKEVSALINLFDYVGNSAVRQCLTRFPMLRPSSKRSRRDVIPSSDYSRLYEYIQNQAGAAYPEVRARALVALALCVGPRTKEIRLADVEDLDVIRWIFTVKHPKGEDSYADARFVPIPPSFRAVLLEYLEVREDHNPRKSSALFPPARGCSLYLSGNSIRKILKSVHDSTGVIFSFQDARRTFGQSYLDAGIDSIEDVSVLMGHATTKTTEDYYCRRRNSRAAEAARRTWDEKIRSAEDGVRTHDLRISLEEVC